MNRILIAVAVLGLSCSVFAEGENDWRSWRGPDGTGVAPSGDPPAKWTEETIKWKVAIPGQGHSSPIVLGDRIFVMTASGELPRRPLRLPHHHRLHCHRRRV